MINKALSRRNERWQIVKPPLGKLKAVESARDQSKVPATVKAGSTEEGTGAVHSRQLVAANEGGYCRVQCDWGHLATPLKRTDFGGHLEKPL